MSKGLIDKIREYTVSYTPELLLGVGLAGMLASTVSAVKATPKAMEIISEEEDVRGELNTVEKVKVAWKPYIPSMIGYCSSTVCILGANYIQSNKNATLLAAYKIGEKAFTEYKDKVVETIGEEKEKDIRQSISRDRMNTDPVTTSVIINGNGGYLCYDTISGRYFNSDTDKINKAINTLNRDILNDMYSSLNDFYDLIGIPDIKAGYELGWNSDMGAIDMVYTGAVAESGEPCMVIDFSITPIHDFNKFS